MNFLVGLIFGAVGAVLVGLTSYKVQIKKKISDAADKVKEAVSDGKSEDEAVEEEK